MIVNKKNLSLRRPLAERCAIIGSVMLAVACGQSDLTQAVDKARSAISDKEAAPEDDFSAFDAFVEDAIAELNGAGLAIGIVKDGETVLLKGYGVADIEDGTPYTPQTVQNIGSVTKLMNSDAVSILAERGELSITNPIKKYLPYFEMKDPWVSEHATAEDVLAYRLGSTITDMENYYLHVASGAVDEKTEDYIRRFQDTAHYGRFRAQWDYGNELFAIPAGVVEAVSGRTFADFLDDELFGPLGMRATGLGIGAYDETTP